MAQHVLDMIVKMQTGDVATGLNGIESKIQNIIEQVSNFKPNFGLDAISNSMAAISNQAASIDFSSMDSYVESYEEIQDVLKTTAQLTGLVNDRNIENVLVNQKDLSTAIRKAEVMKEMGMQVEGLATAQKRLARMSQRTEHFYGKIDGLITNNAELIDNIRKDKVKLGKLDDKQLKDVKQIVKHLEAVKDAGVDIKKEFGVTADQLEKMNKFSKEAKVETVKLSDVMKKTGSTLAETIPGLGEFAKIVAPLTLLAESLKNVNDIYEKNHTVNNLFLADSKKGISLTTALAKSQLEAAHSGVLMSESREAMNAILQNGVPAIIKNSDELADYTNQLALNSRATGINERVLGELVVRSDVYADTIGRTTKVADVFVNVMRENALTAEQMSKMANILQKDLLRLDSAYTILNKKGEVVVSGADAIISSMGAIAKAAKDAGGSADSAMDLMAAAIERPLSVAALLQGSLTSNDINEQFIAMGDNAVKFADRMKRLPPALQGVFAQKLGTTPDQLLSMAAASKNLNEEARELAKTRGIQADAANLVALKQEILLERSKESEKAAAAQKSREEAAANAARQMALAFDNIRKVFARVAIAMQPFLEAMASFIEMMMRNPVSATVLAISGAVLGLLGPIKLLSSAIGKLGGSAGGGVAKGLGGLGQGISNFFHSMAKMPISGAIKGAAAIALVGAALAGGVYLIGLAAKELPPDKTANLLITIGGIVAAAYALVPLGSIGAQALVGALAVAAVGAALAAGIYLIGKAAAALPAELSENLLIVVGGIVAASYALIPLGSVGAQVLLGALAVAAVGAALASGIYLLNKSIAGMTTSKIKMLGIMAGGLVAMAGLLALIGIPAVAGLAIVGAGVILAVAGSLAASVAILGTITGTLENIARSIEIMGGSLSGLTPQMGESLKGIGIGLAAFAAALAGGALAEFFGADTVGQAIKMAEAMAIMEPSIASLASMGEGAANAFKSIGHGLSMISDALSGGGPLDFFSGDTVANARDLAAAMMLVSKPINTIGEMGEQTANAFIKMAVGLQTFMKTLKEDAGWFDTFEENAEDISKAIDKLARPLMAARGGQVEEIKSALALSIDQGNETNEAILEKLEEIREAIEESGGLTGGESTPEVLEELRKTSAILERMFSEMSMGSSFGSSMADTRYNI